MEILRNHKPRVILTGLLLFVGCSSIQENDQIGGCEGDGLIEATVDRSEDSYDKVTDPVVLSEFMLNEAESIQDKDNNGWDITFRNQVVGIGEIACRGDDGQLYLNSAGAQLSIDYRRSE